MSEPTDIVVPATEEKPTEVTNVVEPSSEVAVEPSAPVPDVPKEEVKVVEPAKPETTPATNDTTNPPSTSDPAPAEPKGDDKPVETSKDEKEKKISFFAKLLNLTHRNGKVDKKKGDKKKDDAPVTPTEETPAPPEEPSSDNAKPEEPADDSVKAAPAEPVKEIEPTPAPVETEVAVSQTSPEEPKSGDEEEGKEPKRPTTAQKLGRRFSQLGQNVRNSVQFRPRNKDVTVPPKVDEAPPKIEEPTPVAPLENPAADSVPANSQGPAKEEENKPPKVIEATPVPVSATA